MELTLEKAKELSEKKWQILVDNGGFVDRTFTEEGDLTGGISTFIPDLEGIINECAMCHYVLTQKNGDCCSCIYRDVCDTQYGEYLVHRNSETAQAVLDAIKIANNVGHQETE